MVKIGAIIQTRFGSTRLPGKVLIKLQNRTVIEHVVNRVRLGDSIDTIIIATPHKQYRNINTQDFLRNVKTGAKILDLWNIYRGKLDHEKKVKYVGLGRGDLK